MKKLILLFSVLIPLNCFALDIYNYGDDGYYISKGEAGVSPLDKKPLIPAKATTIVPPKRTATEEPKFENGKWVMVASREYIKKQEEDKYELLQTKNIDGVYIYKQIDKNIILKTSEEVLLERKRKLIDEEKRRLRTIEDTKLEEQAKLNLGLK